MKDSTSVMLPEECQYTAEHVWIRVEGAELVAGITDFAQDQLGEVAYVDLPAVGAKVEAGAEFGTVESLKSVNQLYMPVSGDIIAVNTALEDSPTLINAEPYKAGWIIRIRPQNSSDIQALLTAAAYRATL